MFRARQKPKLEAMSVKRPRILAPVANLEMLQAAIENGGDEVYCGFPEFNARARTIDHSVEELSHMIALAARHDVAFHLALNILIFENELRETLPPLLEQVLASAPTSLIVQDIGLAIFLRKVYPQLELHASTQMTVTSSAAISFYSEVGFSRFNLSREVSIPEMHKIRKKCEQQLEVFVHGALCVSYSGQCLTSESFGGRSANRGQCAQSCRLEYELVVDSNDRDFGNRKYPVSPQDLIGLQHIDELKSIGIDVLKIEGRYKSNEYVAATSRAYKNAVLGKATDLQDNYESGQLQTIYSRGGYPGWLQGVNHQQLVDGTFNSHRGRRLGKIKKLNTNRFLIIPDEKIEISPGDGLRLETEKGVTGGKISQVFSNSKKQQPAQFEITFHIPPRLNFSSGTAYLSSSDKLSGLIQKNSRENSVFGRVPLALHFFAEANKPLLLRTELVRENVHPTKLEKTFSSDFFLQEAREHSLSEQTLHKEFSRLTGTPFYISQLTFDTQTPVYMPAGELKKFRQATYQSLIASLEQKVLPRSSSTETAETFFSNFKILSKKPSEPQVKLNLLVRDPAQLDKLDGSMLDTVYLDFEHGRDYAVSVARVREMGFKAGIATTRILKETEYFDINNIRRVAPDLILVRNAGALYLLNDFPVQKICDFSLNITNSVSAHWFLEHGISRFTPAQDLNAEQLVQMLQYVPAENCEAILYQYLPAFHMEHCVFAAYLSNGTSYKDCGRPCEKHRVDLKDRTGALHPLKADMECRNTMFNGRAQSSARLLPQLISLGVENFRFEALYESADELRYKIDNSVALLHRKLNTNEYFTRMGAIESVGIGEGRLFASDKHLPRKKI